MALILIVDDSPTEIFVLKKILEKHQHQVITASDGQEAFEQAKTIRPHLILMDVVMPNVNGYQTTRQLSREKSTANIPIIMVSANDTDSDKNWGIKQGAKGFLGKPVSEQQLIAEVNKLLGLE